MSKSIQQLPESLMVKPKATVDTMNIETSILDPTTITQHSCRFVLERKGILDVGSCVQISVHNKDATADNECFLPIRTGISSCIKRAILRVGTTAVATSDQFGKYHTIKRQFKTVEEKTLKDFITKGCIDGMEGDNSNEGLYQPKNLNWEAGAKVGVVPESICLTSSRTECPVFTLKLSELFPMMRNVMLPLYLIHQPVSIELTFQSQGSSVADKGKMIMFKDGFSGDTSAEIGVENVKFLADYLTYTDDRMEETARVVMSDTGLVMPYEDLILTNTSVEGVNVGAGVVQKQDITREIGLSGKVVRSIVGGDYGSVSDLLGIYNSGAFPVADSYNVRINDKLRYNRDVERESYKQNQLSQVFGTDISVLNGEYSLDVLTNKQDITHPINNNIITDATLFGHIIRGQVEGRQHYMGVDLTKSPLNILGVGTQIGQKPVSILRTLNRTQLSSSSFSSSYWAHVEREMVLKGGEVKVSA